MRAGTIEADLWGAAFSPNLELGAAAVAELVGMFYIDRQRPFDMADTRQRIAYELCFGRQLRGVRQMLQLAAATATEILAVRLAPLRRGGDDINYFCAQQALLHGGNTHAQAIAGGGAGYKQHAIIATRETLATVDELLYAHFQFVTNLHRFNVTDIVTTETQS